MRILRDAVRGLLGHPGLPVSRLTPLLVGLTGCFLVADVKDGEDTGVHTGTRTDVTTTSDSGPGDDTGPEETTEPTETTDPTETGNPVDPQESSRQACVDEINAHRATLGLPAYARWTKGEACADEQARQDSESGQPHGAFGQCEEAAQNECAGWPSAGTIIDSCLLAMWNEGPGEDFALHGHFLNMSSVDFTRVACGFYETPSGDFWSTQDFR